MRISESIYVIAGGTAGAGVSCDLDCNVYLVDGGAGYALIDCGSGVETGRLAENLERWGFSPKDCRCILLTHAHADHSAGARWLSEYTGAEVMALEESAAYVRSGDVKAISLDVATTAGVYPEGFVFPSCPVRELVDGGRLAVGNVEFVVVATPGHCSGHCTFFAHIDSRNVLFAGDLVFPGGTIALQPLWDCSVTAYAASIARVAELAVDALIPSHHGFGLSGGWRHIATADRIFRKLGVPPNAE